MYVARLSIRFRSVPFRSVPFRPFGAVRSVPSVRSVRFCPFGSVCSIPFVRFRLFGSVRSVPSVRFRPFGYVRSVPSFRFRPFGSVRFRPASGSARPVPPGSARSRPVPFRLSITPSAANCFDKPLLSTLHTPFPPALTRSHYSPVLTSLVLTRGARQSRSRRRVFGEERRASAARYRRSTSRLSSWPRLCRRAR